MLRRVLSGGVEAVGTFFSGQWAYGEGLATFCGGMVVTVSVLACSWSSSGGLAAITLLCRLWHYMGLEIGSGPGSLTAAASMVMWTTRLAFVFDLAHQVLCAAARVDAPSYTYRRQVLHTVTQWRRQLMPAAGSC
jgi:hypothetical protein